MSVECELLIFVPDSIVVGAVEIYKKTEGA
jgi:hypothetical protein